MIIDRYAIKIEKRELEGERIKMNSSYLTTGRERLMNKIKEREREDLERADEKIELNEGEEEREEDWEVEREQRARQDGQKDEKYDNYTADRESSNLFMKLFLLTVDRNIETRNITFKHILNFLDNFSQEEDECDIDLIKPLSVSALCLSELIFSE